MNNIKYIFLSLLLLNTSLQLCAQNSSLDTLKKILAHATVDSAKGKALSNLAFELISYGHYAEAMSYISQEKILYEKINSKKGMSDVFALLGTIWYEQGVYPEALRNYYKSLALSESIQDKITIADALENISLVYYAEGNYEEALTKHFAALHIYNEIGRKEGSATTLINIGTIYLEQKKYTVAKEYYFKALAIEKTGNDKHGYIILLSNIGALYKAEKDYSNALKYTNEALVEATQLNDKTGLSDIYINIGNLYSALNNSGKAIDYFKKGLSVSKEIGSLNYIKNAYKGLSEEYGKQQNYEEAFINYKNFILYRDSLFNEDNTKKLVRTQMQYDFDKKEAETKVKQQIKDAVAKKELQKQKIVKVAIAFGAALLLLVMLLLFNRRKAVHNLQVNRLENKTLRSQLNPHFIFNALASIQKYMDEHPELAQNYLAKFGKLMREVLENSEKETISLSDEFMMLKKYMDLESLRVKNGFDYEIIIDEEADAETIQLPPLIFQPVVENAIWHGVANGISKGKITIRVTLKNDVLLVEVENRNDKAQPSFIQIAEEEKKKSFGLQIVRDRLILLSKEKRRKGNLTLLPTETGMKVMMEIPV